LYFFDVLLAKQQSFLLLMNTDDFCTEPACRKSKGALYGRTMTSLFGHSNLSAPQLDFKASDDADVYERELDRLTSGQGPVSFELETAHHQPTGATVRPAAAGAAAAHFGHTWSYSQ
jgi:hypothetical protein